MTMQTSNPTSPTTRRRSTHSTTIPGRSTPTHSRRVSQPSPTNHDRNTSRTPASPKSPAVLAPRTPETPTSPHANLSSSQHSYGAFGGGGDSGLDSLENELAGAWDEDDDGTGSMFSGGSRTGTETPQLGSPVSRRREKRSSDTSMTLSPTTSLKEHAALENIEPSTGRPDSCNGTPIKPPRRHTKTRSRFDDFDFGPEVSKQQPPTRERDEELTAFTPEMRMIMHDIELLTQHHPPQSRNTSISIPSTNDHQRIVSNGEAFRTKPSDPVAKLLANLRNLAPQIVLETLTTRLITAHTSLASHLTYQTRTLHTLTQPLFSPLCPLPDVDTIDAIIPLLDATLALLPQPSHTSLNSLAHLERATDESASSLAGLSDSLHMCRQAEGEASRKLRVCREGVGEWRREMERGEEARKFIEEGAWAERLRERRAAGVCREVCEGFEAEVEGWRARLLGGADAVGGSLEDVPAAA